MVAAPYGLAITDKKTPEDVADELGKVPRPAVIWLHFQDCTGCTESMLQTSHPGFADLILNVISLEYHETLMAGSGQQARRALEEAVSGHSGKYILVVEGSIPTKDQGVYMKLAGRPALFGMLNWTHTWFNRAGAVSEQQVADIAADMFLQGLPH